MTWVKCPMCKGTGAGVPIIKAIDYQCGWMNHKLDVGFADDSDSIIGILNGSLPLTLESYKDLAKRAAAAWKHACRLYDHIENNHDSSNCNLP